jgi:hypothetical protein
VDEQGGKMKAVAEVVAVAADKNFLSALEADSTNQPLVFCREEAIVFASENVRHLSDWRTAKTKSVDLTGSTLLRFS